MSDTVTVASLLPLNVRIHGISAIGTGVAFDIMGTHHPEAVEGYGLTYNVDVAVFDRWMAVNPKYTGHLAIATQDQIDAKRDPAQNYGYELGLTPVEPPEPPPSDPPVNVDVPYVWQEEQRMRCTMGNWENAPVRYDYQWVQDGTLDIGPNNDTLPMLASNDGHSITCIVTAVNAAGATAAPPSNAIVYHAPTEATAALLISGDFSDDEWSAMIAQIGSNPGAWLGFDIVVDGINLTLRAQFPAITTAQDICNVINSALGAYLTASVVTTFAPWQFNIHSNSIGVASTISYASAPSHLAGSLMDSVVRKATTDISITMRLRQSVGAITVQGIDPTAET